MSTVVSSLRAVVSLAPVVCLLWATSTPSQTYTFTTIAGSPGQAGSVDGTNNGARFNNPSSIALDSSGNLYVADAFNHTIRKLARAGTDWVVTTVAGMAGQSGSADGTNSGARFYRPRGIAVDESGVLFVADYYNNTLRRLTPEGTNWIVDTIAGLAGVPEFSDGYYTNALFRQPTGVAVAPSGALFLADMNNHIIRQAQVDGGHWLVTTIAGYPGYPGWTNGIGEEAEFSGPYSLVVADDTTLFVSDTGNNGIRQVKLESEGWNVTTIAGLLNSTNGSTDGEGSLARFYRPVGIARDGSGNLFVADQENHTIRLLVPTNGTWLVSTIAGKALQSGTNDGAGLDARFKRPWGVAVDKSGVLYIADHSNHTIRMGTPSGTPVNLPVLFVTVTNNTLVLSWSSSAASFVLETSSSLEPGAMWTEIQDGIATTTDWFVFSGTLGDPAAFYRLRQR